MGSRCLGRLYNRLNDGEVAGAPADIAGDGLPYLRFGRGRRFLEKRHRRHEEPWRAKATLEGMLVLKRLLKRVEMVSSGEALDRHQACTICLDGEQEARAHGLTIQEDRTRSAHPMFTPQVCAGEGQIVAQEVRQCLSHLDRPFIGSAVNRHGHAALSTHPG